MRLYHFKCAKFGIESLTKGRLKISTLNELNDPFEMLCWNTKDPSSRLKLKKWKDEHNSVFGIVCFSQKWSNPLLWSHYADRHKGIAIEFNVPDHDPFYSVRYRRKRPIFPDEISDEQINDLILTKFSPWRYESEYRCFCVLKDSVFDNGFYFENFSNTMKPTRVIVGQNFDDRKHNELSAACRPYPGVEIIQSRSAFRTFSIVRDRRGYRYV